MLPKIKYYLSSDYLFTVVKDAKYNDIYLYLSILLLAAPIIAKLVLLKFDRPKEIYKRFDSIWFWSSIALGLVGLFIWFSRVQNLPLFSTRFVSYCWLISILIVIGISIWFYFKKVPAYAEKYYKKTRKKRYL